MKTLVLVLMVALLCTACVSVAHEPALPMPTRPDVTFRQLADDAVCMTVDEANAMVRYIRALNEFEAARERLLNP